MNDYDYNMTLAVIKENKRKQYFNIYTGRYIHSDIHMITPSPPHNVVINLH